MWGVWRVWEEAISPYTSYTSHTSYTPSGFSMISVCSVVNVFKEAHMLRITVMSQAKKEVVLKVEGWVAGEDVVLLEQEGGRWLQQVEHLTLDLSGIRFIDEAGVALLKRWSKEGVALRGAPMFVRELLTGPPQAEHEKPP